jgi:hypothetical protein
MAIPHEGSLHPKLATPIKDEQTQKLTTEVSSSQLKIGRKPG